MSKKKNEKEVEFVDAVADTKPVPAPTPVAKPRPIKFVEATKTYSFEQWVTRRDIPIHHRRGLRAFIKNPDRHRSLEAWDALFVNY